MPWTRNRLWTESEYQGRPIDNAPYRDCPCRPCWLLYHFPYWTPDGKRRDNFDCVQRANYGCPSPEPEPVHVVYLSRKVRCAGVTKCLRCGEEVSLEQDRFVVVRSRKREEVRKELERLKKIINKKVSYGTK